ncbi:hypothetical protein QBC40DRAFT_239136 [Triangularia verruculosa]|uniref:Uncharacterized protein n=1 Tax=Triangularia verruculosa TaxID=2587418 RepID=A0AAN7AP03_9PEZI|nr:hypothetical protein QBC40DRAFT_239136 [Triangularia verruculosa]
MSTEERAPLLSSRQGLPVAFGSSTVQDHPIFLRVCHSPWSCVSQSALVYLRGLIFWYLTGLAGMLFRYKFHYEYPQDDGKSNWCILFEFASLAYLLLWLYHLIAFCWSFTHLFYPDVDEDDRRWESVVLSKMSPPLQTPQSRKRFYFSIFYTVVHVFVFMNSLIYWTVLVPQGYGHFPQGEGGESISTASAEEFFGNGWFEPFCIINLYIGIPLIALFEIFVLNSIKRQVPVPAHVFATGFFLSAYLGWAAFGKLFTGLYPFFWMDPEIMEKTEYIASYVSGFVGLGPTVFAFLYGLIGMRENLTQKDGGDKKHSAQSSSRLEE